MRRLGLVGVLVAASAGALPAQSVLERTPNLHGTWGLQAGHAAFAFAHRFEFIEGGDELFNIPTLTLALGLALVVRIHEAYRTIEEDEIVAIVGRDVEIAHHHHVLAFFLLDQCIELRLAINSAGSAERIVICHLPPENRAAP